MTQSKLIERDSGAQVHCLACEALERDRTADARALLAIARRCVCGGVCERTLRELAVYALEDAEAERERQASALVAAGPAADP
jgi:hypothetical protein